jgi:hypothetical protein
MTDIDMCRLNPDTHICFINLLTAVRYDLNPVSYLQTIELGIAVVLLLRIQDSRFYSKATNSVDQSFS